MFALRAPSVNGKPLESGATFAPQPVSTPLLAVAAFTPVDDVVDITLRVAEGVLCTSGVKAATASKGVDTGCGANVAPDSSSLPFTDGARSANTDVSDDSFPYLKTPIAGSPNGTSN